jgi:hypothetical protein
MIPWEPKQAPKDPELDPHEIDLCYVIGYRPRRWSMKVLFKGYLLLFSINPPPVSVYNLNVRGYTRITQAV